MLTALKPFSAEPERVADAPNPDQPRSVLISQTRAEDAIWLHTEADPALGSVSS